MINLLYLSRYRWRGYTQPYTFGWQRPFIYHINIRDSQRPRAEKEKVNWNEMIGVTDLLEIKCWLTHVFCIFLTYIQLDSLVSTMTLTGSK